MVNFPPPPGRAWREELAWAAGFFDGEGCSTNTKKAGPIRLLIGQADREVLDRFQTAVFGLGSVTGPSTPKKSTQRPVWRWSSNSSYNSQAVIATLWLFLGSVKKEQYKRCLVNSSGIKAAYKNREHCPKGHPYNEENTIRDRGRRRCQACRKLYAKVYNKANWKRFDERKKARKLLETTTVSD